MLSCLICRTFISDGLQHTDVDVVDQIQHWTVGEHGIPQNEDIIHGKFATKQQTNRTTVQENIKVMFSKQGVS